MMKCFYCSGKLESKWNYCPDCGHRINHQNVFVNMIHRHLEQIRKRFSAPTYDSNTKEQGGITISITAGFGSPEVSVGPAKLNELQHYQNRPKKKIERPQPKDMIEPQTMIKKAGNNIFVNAHLPGIKSEDDVEINVMPNSVELRAYAEEKGYFKILDIPNSFDLVDKKLKNEKLQLQFSQ